MIKRKEAKITLAAILSFLVVVFGVIPLLNAANTLMNISGLLLIISIFFGNLSLYRSIE